MHCTLDIEASGFGRHSYPIEVGYVRDDGLAWCTLIRPLPEWTHWDDAAARMHGIPRDALLMHGRAPAAVARALNEGLAGRTVYCDGWAHDYTWLNALFEAAGFAPSFKLESVQRLLDDQHLPALDPALQRLRAGSAQQRHRASSDARVLQQALDMVLQTRV
ncbi:MAG: hypothetical protein IV093_09780 [Rubrivivax sp.]|nr:hypothetical protein [Rubrivivax sp.]